MNSSPEEKPPARPQPAEEPDSRPFFDFEDLAQFFDANVSAAASAAEEKTPQQTGEKYVVFELDGKSYAVHSHQVAEVFAAPAVAPLPNAPAWLSGIASLRGEVTAVVDLRRLWRRQTDAPSRMKSVVLRSAKSDARAAFLIDRLGEIVTLAPQDISFSAADFEASFPAVFGRATASGRELFLLDAETLLASLVFSNSAAL